MSELQLIKQIDSIERCIADDQAAREQLRALLFSLSKNDKVGSLADALRLLANHKAEHRLLAPVILRFLPIPGLIPESTPANQIARSVVNIVTGSLPELCQFLGVQPQSQTFENFAILRGAHDRICYLLTPLQRPPTTLQLFLEARQPVSEFFITRRLKYIVHHLD